MSEVKQSIYKTAAVVTLLSVAERFLGFVYRMILSRAIGSEGMGLYQVALSVFAVFVTVTSSGLPITLSRVITKHKAKGNLRGEQASFSAAVILTLAFCVPVFCLLFFGNGLFSLIFSDERCVDVFVILLFGLVFTSVYAVVRGFFWGNKQFFAYSFIELVEEIVMIAVGTFLVLRASDIFSGAKRAAAAVVISYICSFTIAVIYFLAKGGRAGNPKGAYRPLLSSALPITAMRASSSLISSLVAVLMPLRLMASGMTSSEAMSEFGVAFGMAIPVLSMPSTIIGSIALVLVPELSERFYKKQHALLQRDIENAVKTSALIACALIPFLFVFGRDMGVIVYSDEKSGEMISSAAFMLLPMSLTMISTSMLNSLNLEKKTLLCFAAGSALMLASVYFLPAYVGIYALLIGMAAEYLLCSVLNLSLLKKTCVQKPRFEREVLVSFACCLFVCAGGQLLYALFSAFLPLFAAIALAAALMAGALALLFAAFGLIPEPILKKLFQKKRHSY